MEKDAGYEEGRTDGKREVLESFRKFCYNNTEHDPVYLEEITRQLKELEG